MTEDSGQEKERVLPHLTQADLTCIQDEHGRDHYFMPEGRAVCGRLKKEHNRAIPDEACLGIPMASGPCRIHGGKAGAPIKHGRYSRAMKVWRGAFQQALSDQDLLDTRADLAMMDVVTEQLVEQAEDLDCPSWRAVVKDTFTQLQRAIRAQRQADVGAQMKRLGELIERGATAAQVAQDLVATVDKRAARANRMSELKLRREEKLTVSEVAAVLRQFMDILEQQLDPTLYSRLLPQLRTVAEGPGEPLRTGT